LRRVIEQVKSRRKFLIASFIIGLVCYLLLEFVSARYIVAFTRQGH